ncbi:MAG: hypothetical protein IJE05_07095 [Clostridia bacterium]|nr:hypothetical protein [Clostridia bacterium]
MKKNDKDKMDKLLKYIKERFARYQTYYQILGIRNCDITDENVKLAYERKCTELKALLKDSSGEQIEEIRIIIQTALDDAYMALKDENSRKHYQELLDNIEGIEK